MVRALYRATQVRRHIDNWKELPASILRDLTRMASNIKPPDPTEALTNDILAIFTNAGTQLLHRVQQHFTERLQINRDILSHLNPADHHVAKDTAYTMMSRTGGRKLNEAVLRSLITEEAANINSQPATIVQDNPVAQPAETIDQNKPIKRVCRQTTPPNLNAPTTSTYNRYEPLAMMIDPENEMDSDADEIPPSPPSLKRKVARVYTTPTNSTTTKMHPTTSAAPQPMDTPASPQDPSEPEANLDALLAIITDEADNSPPAEQPTPAANNPPTIFTRGQPDKPIRFVPPANTGTKRIYNLASVMAARKETWTVQPLSETEVLVISDSNMRLVEPRDIPSKWQLAVLPGAKLHHLPEVLNKLHDKRLKNIFISVGINNRQDPSTSPRPELFEKIASILTKKATHAFAVGISTCHLPESEQTKINSINHTLKNLPGVRYVQHLEQNETTTMSEINIHHNKNTVSRIWSRLVSSATLSSTSVSSSSPSTTSCIPTKN